MSLTFQILPDRKLVYVRYVGTALIEQSARVFGAYAAHPDFAEGQTQLIDLSALTGFERDYPRIFDLQMRKADVFVKRGQQALIVYYAPHETALKLANIVLRLYDNVSGTCPRIVQTSEADALQLIGASETRFKDLLTAAPVVRTS